MGFTNDLKPQMDLPVWEHCRFAPVASSALSGWCSSDSPGARYIYYLVGTAFYRYDTVTETYQLLASPIQPALTCVSLRYTTHGGSRGNVLNVPSGTQLTIPGYSDGRFLNQKIRITDGTGEGQERTITDISDITIYDYGVATAAATTSLTDSTKKWDINQFVGYQCRIVFNTGLTQIRKILYNNATVLYFQDANYQQLESWNNTNFAVAPNATAGTQAHFTIESVDITVDSAWGTNPDDSSSFVIMTGGIWMATSFASAPWMQFQYYDIASDVWTPKTSLGGHLLAALGTDVTIERTGEVGGSFLSGTTTSSTTRTLVDSTKTIVNNRWRNYILKITAGTGVGQEKVITGNTTNTFYVETVWDIAPDATSTYEVWANKNRIYLAGNNMSTLYKYHVEADNWIQGPKIDYGVATSMSVAYKGQQPFAMTTGVRGTTGITGLAATPTAGGTGYSVGTVLTITGPTSAQAIVTSESGGVVTGVALFRAGTGASVASGIATTAGAGTGCTVQVTSVGTIGRITTAINHNLLRGDSITIKGCTDSAWNTTYTVLATDALTTFDIIITAAATAGASAAQSTTVLVDAYKNWAINELAGTIIQINTSGPSPTTQLRRITSNTASTITVPTITAAGDGTSRYVIYQPWIFGREEQYKVNKLKGLGFATGGSTTTLIDSSKTWGYNQWVNYKLRIVSGTGYGSGDITITAQTATTLTFTTQTFTPDTTTQYIIMDTFGISTSAGSTTTINDTAKNWVINQFAGKRVRYIAGTGQGQEATILSNTATQLTLTAAVTTASDTTTMYCILATPQKGSGIELNWVYGTTNAESKGRYIWLPRGSGSNIIDRYDITTDLWYVIYPITPQMETFTTGAMYAYDGKDTIILHSYLAGSTKLFALNVETDIVSGCGNAPMTHGAACLGNRMEIIQTVDGVKFLYMMRHTGQEIARTPLWWLEKNIDIVP